MTANDPLSRLERLAKLHESGALSEVEFEREKALLLWPGDDQIEHANGNEIPTASASNPEAGSKRKRRWPWLLVPAGILAGLGGWALADWSGDPSGASQVARSASSESNRQWSPGSVLPKASDRSAIRSLPQQRQVDLAFDAVFGLGEREIRVTEDAAYSYAKGVVVWTEFGPVLIVEGSGEPYPPALGTLGIFYLRELPGMKFEEARRWPDAVTGSIMGNPPQWRIRNDISDHAVIESTGGGVWQGYACDTKTLTELTQDGPRSLASFDSHYDSSGAIEEGYQSLDGTIVNVVRNRSFDVRFTGTRTITQHFVRKGAGYVRTPHAGNEMDNSAIPTC